MVFGGWAYYYLADREWVKCVCMCARVCVRVSVYFFRDYIFFSCFVSTRARR